MIRFLFFSFLILSILSPKAEATSDTIVENDLGFVLTNNGESYRVYGYGQLSGNLVIPSEISGKPVTEISGKGFTGYMGITTVTIPDSVTIIKKYAFADCINLTSVTIPNSVKTIEECAFNGCPKLTTITLPDGLERLGDCVFLGCTGLTTITIPDSVTSIGEDPFRGCNIRTIYCSKNSQAAKVAEKYNIPVEYLCNEHQWVETSTVAATCKAPGSVNYACKNCDETKQTPIDILTTHTYSNWTDSDDDTHTRICTTCSKEETSPHTWDGGIVSKEATCKEEGVNTFTCTVCSKSKTQAIPMLTTHSPETTADGGQICSVCQVILEVPPADTTPTTPSTGATTEPTDTTEPSVSSPAHDQPDKANDSIPTVVIIVSAVIVLGGGAVAGVIFLKKKH